jgi:hypothetical protein
MGVWGDAATADVRLQRLEGGRLPLRTLHADRIFINHRMHSMRRRAHTHATPRALRLAPAPLLGCCRKLLPPRHVLRPFSLEYAIPR